MIHFLEGSADQPMRIAECILRDSLHDPKLRDVVAKMLADPDVTRRQLYDTAFAQGVIATLVAIHEGRLGSISDN